jgi:hypothetical protein
MFEIKRSMWIGLCSSLHTEVNNGLIIRLESPLMDFPVPQYPAFAVPAIQTSGIVPSAALGSLPVGYSDALTQFTPVVPSSLLPFSAALSQQPAASEELDVDDDDEIITAVTADGRRIKKKDEVPMEVDKNYNLDAVLAEAIQRSDYFKDL